VSLSAAEIRETFLSFFEERGHRRVASSSLVPESDPTLLFTNAGMVQFKRTFTGEESRDYKTATTSQKCMRVSGKHDDLENVGRTPRHQTFFEMLGNFSFGDYFKREAIGHAWELLTNGFGIDENRLAVSVFREDDEAHEQWREIAGMSDDRIYRLGESENFWTMGDTGPCGPCSELHIDFGKKPGCTSKVCDPSCDCGRWLEIWNLVFMQFDRDASGTMTPLPRPSIDTGAGLERLACVIQDTPTNYETDLFVPILARVQDIAGVSLGEDPEKDVSLKVAADHARALTFLIGDGVLPANEGRGYVLRRILRRAARHGVLLGVDEPFIFRVADAVIDEMVGAYPELGERRAFITERIKRDEERFLETLDKGLNLLDEEIARVRERGTRVLPGEVVFKLYDTFGFPIDLTADILVGHDMQLDQAGFDASMDEQRTRARAAWKGSGDERVAAVYSDIASEHASRFEGYTGLEGQAEISALVVEGVRVESASEGQEVEIVTATTPFYAESGGQVGDIGEICTEAGRAEVLDTQKPVNDLIVHRSRVTRGELSVGEPVTLRVDSRARSATVRNHSGTHLLHAALREVLGPQAMQKGSMVSPERLRFDFTHDAPLSDDEISRIEDITNEWIEANQGGSVREMSYTDAIEAGAVAIFEEKYGDEVRVISFGDFSTELCGGTHAGATGDIGLLKIVSETGIAAGVRRIEALTGQGALAHVRAQEQTLRRLADLLKTSVPDLETRVEKLLDERKQAEDAAEKLRAQQRGSAASSLGDEAREVGGVKVISAVVDGVSGKELRGMIDDLRGKLGTGVALLACENEGRVTLAVGVTKDLTKRIKAGDIMREVSGLLGGKGGGKPDFAQGGGSDASKLPDAFARLDELVEASA
jgi:alanyl-tRNA synthetase